MMVATYEFRVRRSRRQNGSETLVNREKKPRYTRSECALRRGGINRTSFAPWCPARSMPSTPGRIGPLNPSLPGEYDPVRSGEAVHGRPGLLASRQILVPPSIAEGPFANTAPGRPVEQDHPSTGARKARKPIYGRPRGLPGLSGPRPTPK